MSLKIGQIQIVLVIHKLNQSLFFFIIGINQSGYSSKREGVIIPLTARPPSHGSSRHG